MRPLKDVLPANANNVLYTFYDFEITQTRRILTRLKNMCLNLSVCNSFLRDVSKSKTSIDCERCSRRHSFWNDPVVDLLTYLCEPRPWASKIVAKAHNAKAFDLHFILNRAIMLKWKPDLITNGLKNRSMKMEHLVFLDSVLFRVHCANCPRISFFRPLNPHYFNTEGNLDYVGSMSDIVLWS